MGTRFQNLDGTGPQPFSQVFRWAVTDKLRGRRRKSPPGAAVPRVTPDLQALARPPGPSEGARLTWLGHASWLVQFDGVSLLLDPALMPHIFPRISRNVAPGLSIDELPRIDAQLVSHAHYDHLDVPTLRRVAARFQCPVISGAGIEGYLRRTRLTAQPLEWWASERVGPVTVHYVPAQHWSRRATVGPNESLWGGFVMEGSSATLYHSGDTAYFSGFAEIGRRFPGIDAALLPIGAYDPEWFMDKQHMNPEQAVQAFVDLGARRFFAMHWGTFKLTDEPLDEPPRRLRAEWARRRLDENAVHILPVGGTETVRCAPRADPPM